LDLFEVALLAALDTGEVEILFQPVVRLEDMSLSGVEALARLRDAEGHVWLPDDFMPEAERSGFAQNLSEKIVARAILDFTASFPAETTLWLAINLPLCVFLTPGNTAMVAGQAELYGLAPARITIELTESQPVHDLGELAAAIAVWRASGFKLALDDVEPATHNLWQLLELPFFAVKLDLGIVGRLPDDPVAVDFVTAVVAHTRSRGMKLVAEGIESQAMATDLRRLGVDHAQGFLISPPMRGMLLPAWWCNWLN
jgi:EAL domain-containing protein (putative c-di-GMP-specific phosphodiesterase class I)